MRKERYKDAQRLLVKKSPPFPPAFARIFFSGRDCLAFGLSYPSLAAKIKNKTSINRAIDKNDIAELEKRKHKGPGSSWNFNWVSPSFSSTNSEKVSHQGQVELKLTLNIEFRSLTGGCGFECENICIKLAISDHRYHVNWGFPH